MIRIQNLVGISLTNGTIVSSYPISNNNGSYFDQLQFNLRDSTIYGLARTSAPNEMVYLAKIDPSTGIVTNISSSSVASSEVIPDAAIDPFHRIFYFVDQNLNMVGLSLVSGLVVSSHAITNSNGTYFDQFQYNSNCCSRFPIPPPLPMIKNAYPMPATDHFTVDMMQDGTYTIEVIDSHGQVKSTQQNAAGRNISITTSTLENGFYLVKITDGNLIETWRVMVMN